MSLSERIKEARINAGLTQQALANILGVKSNTITGYESGSREPDALRIIAIARATGVTGDFLLEIEDVIDTEKLSPEALSISRCYDSLDPHGKRVVEAVVSLEAERCGNSAPTAEELQRRAIHGANLSEKSI